MQASTELRLAAGIDSFFTVVIANNTSVTSVHGSVFNLVRSKIELKEGVMNVEMPSARAVEESKVSANESYSVAQDTLVETTQRLLPSGLSLDSLESAMTSVTQKQQGGSLTQVLQQALQSDDQEQLDWILAQKELGLITLTVKAMKQEYVGKLFNTILAKFQQELNAQEQLPIMFWLRSLLKEQWTAILKANKNADLQKLLQI